MTGNWGFGKLVNFDNCWFSIAAWSSQKTLLCESIDPRVERLFGL